MSTYSSTAPGAPVRIVPLPVNTPLVPSPNTHTPKPQTMDMMSPPLTSTSFLRTSPVRSETAIANWMNVNNQFQTAMLGETRLMVQVARPVRIEGALAIDG